MSADVKLNAYFERIGFSGSIAPTLQTLEALHALQPAAIPFENLDSVMGRPVQLDQASLNQKLLIERRGGYCFEQNLMFLRVLRELGFEARGHVARVLWGRHDLADSTEDHMLVTVDIAGVTYLADVGFGGLLLTAPLKLKTGVEQETPLETYRLTGEEPIFRLEVRRGDDKWWPAFEFSTVEVDDAGFAVINARLNASSDWFLARHLLVELCPPEGRRLLFDARLTTGGGDDREIRSLADLGDMRETLATTFGLVLPPDDALDAALARILAPNFTAA
jgi:N-hydroxyarylamine O-acetyltransferase